MTGLWGKRTGTRSSRGGDTGFPARDFPRCSPSHGSSGPLDLFGHPICASLTPYLSSRVFSTHPIVPCNRSFLLDPAIVSSEDKRRQTNCLETRDEEKERGEKRMRRSRSKRFTGKFPIVMVMKADTGLSARGFDTPFEKTSEAAKGNRQQAEAYQALSILRTVYQG